MSYNPNEKIETLLSGGDLRSLGNANSVILQIKNQRDFDELFSYLFHQNRIVVMRAADAIDKITIHEPSYLNKHKKKVIDLCNIAHSKELKWHLASLIPRLQLDRKELLKTWNTLAYWATDKKQYRIVRVNSIQGLFELSRKEPSLMKDFSQISLEIEKEKIPSIKARIQIIRKKMAALQQ